MRSVITRRELMADNSRIELDYWKRAVKNAILYIQNNDGKSIVDICKILGITVKEYEKIIYGD